MRLAPLEVSGANEEDSERRKGLRSMLHIIFQLVFCYLPLSVQAITLAALSKAWR